MKECPSCHGCFADIINHCPTDGGPLKLLFEGEPLIDGRYQLESKIGQGGMGMVFKARHVFLKTMHAVKVILPDLVGNDPTLTTRFRQEAMAAAAIRHPNSVSVTDYGVMNGTAPYLVMEFVEGRSLHELLTTRGSLPAPLAVEIMLAVCEGVAAAHAIGIVHRDLKPLNVLLKEDVSPREGVKVLDFGLAKIRSGELLGSFVAAQTQGLVGSPFYMAPEQWSDDETDARADIYSLGVILYQMLAGDVPFAGRSIPSIMNKHLTSEPPPLLERGVEVPAALEGIVRRALEKEPAHRPQSVSEMMDELRAARAALGAPEAAAVSVGVPTLVNASQDTAGRLGVPGAATGGGPWPGESNPAWSDENSLKTVVGDSGGGFVPFGQSSGAQTVAGSRQPEMPAGLSSQGVRASGVNGDGLDARVPEASSARPSSIFRRIPVPVFGAAVVLLLVCITGLLGYLIAVRNNSGGARSGGSSDLAAAAHSGASANAGKGARRSAMVSLPGGTFRMGRDDVPPFTEEERRERPGYLKWMYQQWPAHAVNIAPFAIDRTEVTIAEYSEFVMETDHPEPPGDVLAGVPSLPVTNVSYEDALAFAAWRSRRDNVTYRLPSEEEWEYAARGGDASRRFPWGDEWIEGRANLGGVGPSPVGTFAPGESPQGVADLIGNVWEWTSSEARMYEGNDRTALDQADRSKVVTRGGSYESRHDGEEPLTATARRWVGKNFRSPVLGFRLVHTVQ